MSRAHSLSLASAPIHSSIRPSVRPSISPSLLRLGNIAACGLSDGSGPAVGVLVVVFGERAALQELPLRVEQAAHATRLGGGVARLARVQRVHGHFGGRWPRVAALPQGRGVSAGGLRGAHAGAAPEAVAVRGYATEG